MSALEKQQLSSRKSAASEVKEKAVCAIICKI